MDSKQIYNAAAYLGLKVKWEEWIHFGTGSEVKYNLITELINGFLLDDKIIFVHERTNSGRCKSSEVIEKIRPYLGENKFQLWNKSMTKVIGFDRIGVLHVGEKV